MNEELDLAELMAEQENSSLTMEIGIGLGLLRQQVECLKNEIRKILPDKDIALKMRSPGDWLKERKTI